MRALKVHLHTIYTIAGSVGLFLLLTSMGIGSIKTPSNYEDRIRAQFRSQHWAEGAVILDSALNEYPQVATFYELKGQHLIHEIEVDAPSVQRNGVSKTYEMARYYLLKSLEMDEKNLNSRRLLLKIDINTKQYSSAIVYCNELLEQNPYNEHIWRTKIDLYRKLGNNIEADRLLERLMTIYPEDTNLRKDVAERKRELAKLQREQGDNQGMEQSLRDLVNLEPGNTENYESLFGFLYRNGRLEEAAQVAEQAVQATNSATQREAFITRYVSVLSEMNRYAEARNYLNSKRAFVSNQFLQRKKAELDIEVARQARWNDPYEAYAKVYDNGHSQEALNYLISTSIQRNYYDDALFYIREARKRQDSPKLHYQEYLVLKRMGHQKKAENTLRELHERVPSDKEVAMELAGIYLNNATAFILQEQYDEAIPLLQYIITMQSDPELDNAAVCKLLNCYLQTKKNDLAESVLESLRGSMSVDRYSAHKAMIMHMRGQDKQALNMLNREYHSLPESMQAERNNLSYSYEEIAVPYIKELVAAGMTHAAMSQVQEALQICPKSNDILRYAISLSLGQRNERQAQKYIDLGMQTFPKDPYYAVKNAQLLIMRQEYVNSADSLRSLLNIYPADSTIILAFSDCSERLALKYMKEHNTQKAHEVLDTALYFNPGSHSLLYTKSLVYRRQKEWKKAEDCLRGYKPDYREYASYRRSMEELLNHQMRNNLSLEYQRARLGSEDAITGNAYLSYTRKLPRLNRRGEHRTDAFTFSLAYAGRDGKANDENASDLTKGGTGILMSAAYEHQFSSRFTGKADLGWSNRYFPTIVGNISVTYDMKKSWQLMARANFRWLKTYTGVYDMVNEFAGFDMDGNPLYANVMKQTNWNIKNKPMAQLGVGFGKTFGSEEHFNVSAGVDGFMLSNNFYANANARMTFFPLQDKRSFIFAQTGVGTAPESSLIDQSLAVGFSNLNTFVSMGGQYFVNRYITLGLTGSWYTMLTQKETLTLPLIGNTAQTTKNYANYFYIHASVILTF